MGFNVNVKQLMACSFTQHIMIGLVSYPHTHHTHPTTTTRTHQRGQRTGAVAAAPRPPHPPLRGRGVPRLYLLRARGARGVAPLPPLAAFPFPFFPSPITIILPPRLAVDPPPVRRPAGGVGGDGGALGPEQRIRWVRGLSLSCVYMIGMKEEGGGTGRETGGSLLNPYRHLKQPTYTPHTPPHLHLCTYIMNQSSVCCVCAAMVAVLRLPSLKVREFLIWLVCYLNMYYRYG